MVGVQDFGPREYDNLFAGSIQPVVTGKATITGAAAHVRGTVLGRVTANGLCKPVDNSLADGAENVYAILAEDVDATAGDVEAVIYFTGEFNESKLVFGGDDTADDHRVAARNIGLFFKDAVPA